MRRLLWVLSVLGGCAAHSPGQKELVTGGDAAATAQALECGVERSLRSTAFDTKTEMHFANTSQSERRVYWLDYDGRRVHYQTLDAGESYTQQTYLTHPWLITNANDECVAIFIPAPQARRVEIP